jgi:RHS repeat-associated protein
VPVLGRVRLLSAGLSLAVFAGLVAGLPPVPVAASPADPASMTSVPMSAGKPSGPASLPDLPAWTAPGAALPQAASATLEITPDPIAGLSTASLPGASGVSPPPDDPAAGSADRDALTTADALARQQARAATAERSAVGGLRISITAVTPSPPSAPASSPGSLTPSAGASAPAPSPSPGARTGSPSAAPAGPSSSPGVPSLDGAGAPAEAGTVPSPGTNAGSPSASASASASTPASPGASGSSGTGLGEETLAAAAASGAGSEVQISVLGPEVAKTANFQGVLLTARPDKTVTAPVSLALGYGSFAGAYGAGWGSRLRLVEFPACFLTTPKEKGCRDYREIAGAVNDPATQTISAPVALAGAGVFALTAGASSENGNFGATPLNQSLAWAQGGSSGDFTTSLSVKTTPVPGGLAPQLGLNYSSGSVDGLTESTNNQANVAGEGWSMSGLSYVERSYRPCKHDGVPANQGDLCFVGWAPLTLVLNGQSTRLIVDSAAGAFVAENASLGWKTERLLNAANDVYEGEHFKVTTMDGTEYYFGSRQRGAGGGAARVTVFGNNPGEPCYNAGGFGISGCTNMGYKWYLDRVVDRHGNTMTYHWEHYVNAYGAVGNLSMVQYDQSTRLNRVDYGSNSVLQTGVSAQAHFGYAYRCNSTDNVFCENNPGAANWPDTPWDQYCRPWAETSCPGRTTPTFWTPYRLDNIVSTVHNRVTAQWEQVDALALNHTYPATGDFVSPAGEDSLPALWLNYGLFPEGVLAIETSGVRLPNRVAWGEGQQAGQKAPMMHYRLNAFSDATGGLVNVNYSGAECTAATTTSILTDRNNLRCYPIWESGAWRWYHKYVVNSVENRDRTGSSPSVWTRYEYTTQHVGSSQGQQYANALWRFDHNYLLPEVERTYSQWRGYPVVYTRTGSLDNTGVQQVSQDVYFRGMSGDFNGRQVVVTDGEQNYDDHESLTGKLLRHTEFDGYGGQWRTMDISRYTPIHAATQNIGPGVPSIKAWRVDATHHISKLNTPGFERRTEAKTTYSSSFPLPIKVEDLGETYVSQGTSVGPGDDTCTTTSYVTPDTAKWLISFPAEAMTTNCAPNPGPNDYLAGQRNYYGSSTLGQLGAKADVTETRSLKAAGEWIATTATYDGHGRVTSATDALGRVTQTQFVPATGGPVEQVKTVRPQPTGPAWTEASTLDIKFGVPVTLADVNNKVTRAEYDKFGRLVRVWKNDRAHDSTAGKVPDAEYRYVIRNTQPSFVGTKLLNVEGTGQMTESFTMYDSLMRPRRTETPGATGTGRMINDTVYGPVGQVSRTSTFYNASPPSPGFDTFNESAAPQHTRFGYNNFGEQTLSEPFSMGTPLGAAWNTVTTYDGRITKVTPPQGATATTTVTDAQGRTAELRQHQGGTPDGPALTTRYTYDRSGNLTGVTDPAGTQWQYWYDLLGRKIKTSDPDAGVSETTYLNDGNAESTKDALGQQLWNKYDHLGRQIERRADSANGPLLTSWTYDTVLKGQLTSSTRHDASGAYTTTVDGYTNAYQPLSTTFTAPGWGTSGGTLTYTVTNSYKPSGAPNTSTLPGVGGLPAETLTTGYNPAGLAATLTSSQDTYVAATVFDHDGTILSRDHGTLASKHLRTGASYDPATRRLTGIGVRTYTNATAFAESLSLAYSYDPAGNIRSINDDVPGTTAGDTTECFTYDYLRRLEKAWTQAPAACATPQRAGTDPYWREWTFDTIGNRETQIDHGPTGVTEWEYVSGAEGGRKPHQLVSVTATGRPTRTFTYDLAGNTKTRTTEAGVEQVLHWDKEGHLASIAEPGATTTYVYGVDGQRLLATSPAKQTLYLPDGTELEKLTSGGSILAQRYIGGVAVRDSSGLNWTVTDHQGTPIAQYNSLTLASAKRKDLPYGEPRGPQPSWLGTKGYVGGTTDPTGLTHLGAREYDPTLGRFISIDPIMDMADPQQWHPYTYANASPVTLSDPSGLKPGNPDEGQDANGKGRTSTCDASCQQISLLIDQENETKKEIADANETLNKDLWHVLADAGVDFLLDLIGYNDAVACFDKGDLWACGSLALTFNPFGKLFKGGMSLVKAFDKGVAAFKGLRAAQSAAKATLNKAMGRLASVQSKLKEVMGTARKCGNSFNPETEVLLADGSTKPIVDIKIGDIVLATDPENDVSAGKQVTALHLNEDLQLTDLTVLTADGAEALLPTTWHHEIWAESRQAWVHASELTPGDTLLTPAGETVSLKAVHNYTGRKFMHDLTVADIHTYYVLAATTPVLVHNCGGFDLRGKDPMSIVPDSAEVRWLKPDPNGGAQYGVEFKWKNGSGQTVRMRAHGPDGTAPPGSNAAIGDTFRVSIAGRYQDLAGNLFHKNVHNPNSPFYNPAAANDTHIPWPAAFPGL